MKIEEMNSHDIYDDLAYKKGIHVSRWNSSKKFWCYIISILSFATRFFNISHPNQIVWDEVHFGKFASYYIKREYFFDVHPPLAKLVFALVGWLFDYDGNFLFDEIGHSFEGKDVPYAEMRAVSALCGSWIVILFYLILVELDFSLNVALIATSLVLLDNGICVQSKFILLDAQLMCFMIASFFCWIKFRQFRRQSFSGNWWKWLTGTGLFLGLDLGVKFVGLFAYGLIGIVTLIDLWELADIKRRLSLKSLIKHWLARILCLIILPAIIFIIPYYLHFKILSKSGTGDNNMSLEFQTTLEGNKINEPAKRVFYGNTITIKSRVDSAFLHSHSHLIPLKHSDGRVSSHGQQVTGYHYSDDNNDWIVYPMLNTTFNYSEEKTQVMNGAIIRLMHKKTNKFLISHDVASPLTKSLQEVAGFEIKDEKDERYENSLWKISLAKGRPEILTKASQFQLFHLKTQCFLNNFQKSLPKWGFQQLEINSGKINGDSTIWFVENALGNFSNFTTTNETPIFISEIIDTPGFWEKIYELIIKSFIFNSKLVDTESTQIPPSKWPILEKGMGFWGSSDKTQHLHLIGNPLAWYLCFFSIPIFLIMILIDKTLEKRGLNGFEKKEKNFLYKKGLFFLMAYAFHYLPFFIMARIVYLHHYLPCYLLSVGVFACLLEFLAFSMIFLKGKIFVGGFIILIMSVFLKFAPLTYGTTTDLEYLRNLRWLSTWNFE